MKSAQITKRTLIESYIRNNDAQTSFYMRKMNENFVVPFNRNVLALVQLTEAEMTAQQIQNAFGSAEKIATAGGDNRSMLGKGADAAGAIGQGAKDLASKGAKGIKELADKILKQNQANFEKSLPPADAGPVEGFEQQAAQAAEQIQDPKAKQSVMDLIKQAVKNPAVQTMVLAAVGGIATVVAGPAIAGLGLGMAATGALTGTVVGGLTGTVRGLMQGEGLKGALKQGAMGAGLGAVGGGVAGAVAQGAQAYMQNKGQTQLPAADADANRAADENAAAQWAAGTPEERAQIEQTTGMTPQQLQSKIPDEFDSGTGKGWDSQAPAANPTASKVGAVQSTPGAENFDGTATAQQQQDASDAIYQQAKASGATGSTSTQQFAGPDAKDQAYGKVRANLDNWRADNARMQESRNPYIDYELTARMWALNESVGKTYNKVHLTNEGIGDLFAKAGNWLKTKAGNVTNKVTADKLQQAWKKAGSPTDSGQVAGIMTGAGVPQETVDQVFKNLGLPAGSGTPAQAQQGGEEQPAQPKQNFLGRAASAVGGALGAVPGAIAGAKDAFKGGKQAGYDSARKGVAGDYAGASDDKAGGEAPQAPAPAQGGQQAPAQGGQQAPAQGGQQAPAQAQAQTQDNGPGVATKVSNAVGNNLRNTGNAVAGGINTLANAVKAGQGMGTSGQSLMTPKADDSYQTVRDETGKEHQYKKVGQKWYGPDNKEVDPATAAMLTRQSKQQAGAKTAQADMDKNAQAQQPAQAQAKPAQAGQQQPQAGQQAQAKPAQAGQQAQAQPKPGLAGPKGTIPGAKPPAAGAQPPANAQQKPGALDPRDLNKDGTVDATEKSIARNKAKTTTQQPAAQPKAGNKDVMGRMAKQLGTPPSGIPAQDNKPATAQQAPAQQTAKPDFSKSITGYGKTNTNAPTAVPNPTAQAQPATGAKAEPAQQPAQQPATANAQFPNGKYDGTTGRPTPEYQAELDKQDAAEKAKFATAQQPAATATDKPAPAQPQQSTGQAATQAANTGGNPEQAATAAMTAQNPKLAGMMAQAGLDNNLDDVTPTAPAATAPKRSVTGDVPVPDNFGKQKQKQKQPEPMAAESRVDFSAALLRKMKQRV